MDQIPMLLHCLEYNMLQINYSVCVIKVNYGNAVCVPLVHRKPVKSF